MIYLTKGQTLFDNPGMVVYDQTGYYDDGSSVICATIHAPEEPVCRYEAKFIAYGNLVYNVTNHEELMEQVLKIDPKSLFGKNNEERAVDKVIENIQTVDSTDTPLDTSEAITNPQQVEDALATSTPPTTDTPITEIIPIENSTTTPPIVTDNISTTTPLTDITF
ncbi:MAG: hypothetical protein NTV02_02670 [Candidatus Zambryskibacteria bacterium]|nr:hypothetical protein [Candidatus Zambryskibacteria bacterium]